MNAHIKALLTLSVLAVLLILGITWGWTSMTSPFPHAGKDPTCVKTTLPAGQRVAAPDVTVSVFNASDRVGLAERTMSSFEDQGFGPGRVGNAPKGTTVLYAQVWTKHPRDPAVRLVLSRLGPRASVRVNQSTQVCSPPTA
jgi:hypothetical protein